MNKPLILIALLALCAGAVSADDQCDSGGQDQAQQGQQSQGGCYGDNGQGQSQTGGNEAAQAPGGGTSDRELDGINCVTLKLDSMVNGVDADVVGKLHSGYTSVVNKGSEGTDASSIQTGCQSGQKDLEGAKKKLKCVPGGIDKILATLGKIREGLQGRRTHETSTNTDYTGAPQQVADEDSKSDNEQETTKQQRDLLRETNRLDVGKATCQQQVNGEEVAAVEELQGLLNDLKQKTGDQGSVSQFNNMAQSIYQAGDGTPAEGIYSCLGGKSYQQDSSTPSDGATPQPGESPKEKFKKNLETGDKSYTSTQNEVQELKKKVKALTNKLTALKGRLPCKSDGVAAAP